MKKSNTQKVREYRERLKADPERWAAYRLKQSEYQRLCRRKKGSVSTPVSTPTTQHMGGKHAAPKTGYHGLPPEALIEQYREHHSKQSPPRKKITPEERAALLAEFADVEVEPPVPLSEYPFIKDLQERIPCTKIKDLPPKEKPQ